MEGAGLRDFGRGAQWPHVSFSSLVAASKIEARTRPRAFRELARRAGRYTVTPWARRLIAGEPRFYQSSYVWDAAPGSAFTGGAGGQTEAVA